MKLFRTGPAVSFHCPGCGRRHTVYTEAAYGREPWQFNGDMDKPTFSPSILYRSHTWEPPVTEANLDAWRAAPWEQTKVEIVCHSFVTDGRIEFLADCTHDMANHTADLPDWEWNGQ